MFISLSRTYIQNFSNWHALFVFLSHSVAVAAWCGTRHVDQQMTHFELFLSPGAQEPAEPPNNTCSLSAAEKNIFWVFI